MPLCIMNKTTAVQTCYQLRISPNSYGWDIYKNDGVGWRYCYNASNVDMLAKWLIQRNLDGVTVDCIEVLPTLYNEAAETVNAMLREAIDAGALPAGSR